MKRIMISTILASLTLLVNAQNNVGINTTSPQATLDVRGSHRFGGNSNYIQFDSATGRIQWTGAQLYVPVLQQIIRHSASAEGLYTGGGKLEYRNTTDPVFFSDWNTGNGYFSGNLGIGVISPLGRLHLRDGSAGVVPFSPSQLIVENSGFTYVSLLSSLESGFLFGKPGNNASGGIIYDNSSTPNGFQFRNNGNITKMVIDNAGRVGIGLTNPNAPLSFPPALGKKITLYPGTTGDVGLGVQGNLFQIYSDNQNADIAFGYDQAGTLTERMRIKGNGNVGIGTSAPFSPLTFNNILGEKISLYGSTGNNYGFGIQGGTLQIHSDAVGADIAFGYGSSSGFTEVMRMKGNGNVGIG